MCLWVFLSHCLDCEVSHIFFDQTIVTQTYMEISPKDVLKTFRNVPFCPKEYIRNPPLLLFLLGNMPCLDSFAPDQNAYLESLVFYLHCPLISQLHSISQISGHYSSHISLFEYEERSRYALSTHDSVPDMIRGHILLVTPHYPSSSTLILDCSTF